MQIRRWWVGVVFALLVLYPARAAAQFETAAVVGTIFDKQNAAVAGAKVTLTNSATGVSATAVTDAAGSFEFFTVRIGTSTSFPSGQAPAPIRSAGVGTDGFLSASRSRGRTARHETPAVTPS